MKNKTALFVLGFLFSCSTAEENKLDDLSWILGEWSSVSGNEILIENWQKNSDTVYVGEAFFITSSDTISTEELKIVYRNEDIYYIALPSGQATTEFKLTRQKENEAMFENPDHDFPKKILYRRISSDSLSVKIEGVINGRQRMKEFKWSKTNK